MHVTSCVFACIHAVGSVTVSICPCMLLSCRNHDVVQKILSVVCRRGLREEEGEDKRSSSSSKLAAKPPPLLEEELALTTSRLTIPS